MDDTRDDVSYAKLKPYMRGVIALLFVLRQGVPHSFKERGNFEEFFTKAEDFLESFEKRRIR